jgi:hypothetical protein
MTTDDRDRLYRLEQIAMSRLLSWRTAMQLSPYLAAMVAGMVVGCYAIDRARRIGEVTAVSTVGRAVLVDADRVGSAGRLALWMRFRGWRGVPS